MNIVSAIFAVFVKIGSKNSKILNKLKTAFRATKQQQKVLIMFITVLDLYFYDR